MGEAECSTSSCWQKLSCEASFGSINKLRLDRAGHQAVVWGRYIYVVAGRKGSTFYQDLLRLDTSSNTWERILSKLPCEARANFGAVLVGHELWIIGGSNNTDVLRDVHVLDLNTLQWRQPNISDEEGLLCRSGFGCDLHPTDKCTIIIYGGYGGSSEDEYAYLNDIVLLHTDRLEVERLPMSGTPPVPRAYCTLTTLGSMCCIYGGRTPQGLVQGQSLLAVLNPLNASWSYPSCSGATVPAPRSSHRAVAFGSRIIMFGGASRKGDGRMNDLQTLLFSPENRLYGGVGAPARLRWSNCDQPLGGEQPPGRSCHTLSIVGGCLYLICGYTGNGDQQRYATDVWKLQLSSDVPHACDTPERPGPLPCKRSAEGAPLGSAPCEDGGWRQTKRVRPAPPQQQGKQHVPANKRQQLVQQGAQAAAAAAASDAPTANQQGEADNVKVAGRVTAAVGRRGRATAVAAVLNADGPLGGQAGAAQQQHACTCPLGAACAVCADYGGPSAAELKRAEEEARQLRWMVEEQQQRTRSAEDTVAELRGELKQAMQQWDVERKDCQRHKSEAEAHLCKLQSEQNSRAQAEARVAAADAENADLRARLEHLLSELTSSKAETKAARAEAAAHEKDVEEARMAMRNARAEWEREARQAEDERQKLAADLADMRARREQLEDSLNGVSKALQTAQAELARERAAAAEAARVAAAERDAFRRDMRELQHALDAAKANAAAQQREAAQLQAALQQRDAQVQNLQARQKVAEDARAKAESELTNERMEKAELRQRHGALKNCFSGLGPDIAQLAALARTMGSKFESGNQKLCM